MSGLLRRILRDERGSAMLDFALLLPILIMLFVGTVEMTSLLRLDRKIVAAAQTTADLITQRRSVTSGDLDDIVRAAELILEPYPNGAVSIGIAGVRFNPNTGNPEVTWSETRNGGSIADATTVAAGLGDKGEGVVVVRVSYSYDPVFFDFLLSPMTLDQSAVMRPRRSNVVQGPSS